MNQKKSVSNDVIEQVKLRLLAWAQWVMKESDAGLGYPRKTMEARLREGGGLLIKGTGKKPLLGNAIAEEMEALIIEMSQHFPRLFEVIIERYLKEDALPDCYKAKRHGCSRSQFMNYLNMAYYWLAAKIV